MHHLKLKTKFTIRPKKEGATTPLPIAPLSRYHPNNFACYAPIIIGQYNNEESKNNKMVRTFPHLMKTTFWALEKCLNLLRNPPMEAR